MNKKTALIATLCTGSIISLTGAQIAPPENAESAEVQIKKSSPYKVGETLPNFELPALNDDGETQIVSLESMLADGPVVLTFFRGGWCPYCVTELKSVEKKLDKIEALGAGVLAISPEEPTHTKKLEKKLRIGFTLATDHDNVVAKKLGLLFVMPEKMIEKYGEYNLDVPASNGTDTWELPIPATYVIDQDRVIRYAFVDEDYSKRADYNDVLDVLKEIKDEG